MKKIVTKLMIITRPAFVTLVYGISSSLAAYNYDPQAFVYDYSKNAPEHEVVDLGIQPIKPHPVYAVTLSPQTPEKQSPIEPEVYSPIEPDPLHLNENEIQPQKTPEKEPVETPVIQSSIPIQSPPVKQPAIEPTQSEPVESVPDLTQPLEKEVQPTANSCPLITGIYIVDDASLICPAGIEGVENVEFNGVVLPGHGFTLAKELENTFIGQPLDESIIPNLKRIIQDFYTENGHPLVLVCVPPQNISNGILQVVVQEARLGQICASGNDWFTEELLTSYISLEAGDPIIAETLLTDLGWMNRNPFRFTQVSFSPGSELGTTDLELMTIERRPIRGYVGIDNTGSDLTSQTRYFAGFTVGNLFNMDHIFGYQFTAAPEIGKFQSHTVNYIAPLPWRHMLMLYGGYAQVHPDICDFHSHGYSTQASLRYTIPVGFLYGDEIKEFRLGFDFKSTNNNLEFTDSARTSIFSGTVNLSQFVVGYNYGNNFGPHELLGSIDVYISPCQLFDKETPHDYHHLRYKAHPQYAYAQLTAGYTYHFSWGSELSCLLRTQNSTTNLLPSEQFCLGGFDTVRGYKEWEVITDNGMILNAELRSPAFSLLTTHFPECAINDEFRVLAFIDFGKGFNHRLFHCERRDYELLSIGPGLRYRVADHLALRFDWGIKLKRSSHLFGWGNKIHFGLVADF